MYIFTLIVVILTKFVDYNKEKGFINVLKQKLFITIVFFFLFSNMCNPYLGHLSSCVLYSQCTCVFSFECMYVLFYFIFVWLHVFSLPSSHIENSYKTDYLVRT